MHRKSSLGALRVSLLAAMGLGACGEVITLEAVQTSASSSAGTTGSGGDATTTGTMSSSSAGGAGSTSSSAGGAGGGSTSGVGGASADCLGKTPVLDPNGADTGFVKCADETIHRVQPVACDPTAGAPACSGMEESIQCMSDADCHQAPGGRCASYPGYGWGGPATICGCTYPCITDADCAAGEVCVCAGVVFNKFHPWSICAPATCKSGQDCASAECGVRFVSTGCGYGAPALACRSDLDTCRLDVECPMVDPVLKQVCTLDPLALGHWQCLLDPPCGIGRPLLVEGRARTARAAARADWAAGDPEVELGDLDAPTRAALARHWLDVAALEHASVASFARFTLHLLALGAPPALIAEAQRAGLDEVEHARLAYGLASVYAGERLGPAALDLQGIDFTAERREILRALIAEACVGETLAVVEARSIAGRVRDPALRRLHERIAADEQRHAELAFRTLAWMLSDVDDALAGFAAQCFEEAMATARRRPDPVKLVAPDQGLLSAEELAAIRRQALREVVAPCSAALLQRARS